MEGEPSPGKVPLIRKILDVDFIRGSGATMTDPMTTQR